MKLGNSTEVDSFMAILFDKTKLKPTNGLDTQNHGDTIEIILIELLPKTYTESHAYQLVCLKKKEQTVTFYNVTPIQNNQNLCPDFIYSLQLLNEEIVLNGNNDHDSKSYIWLLNKVLPQVIRWTDQPVISQINTSASIKDSLSLVPNNEYYTKYNYLKLKYGKEMVKIWPEGTDPIKFVYEDVAIATYLLLLWDRKNLNKLTKPVSFVDVGCGNGLLVYILTKEGHKGLGVDVRKRKIWNMYDEDIKLEETTVTPDNIQKFSEFDWIIGNHSDELTPWIPVMTAKSSYNCSFFLLPCCAYNFDGTKYQRQNSSKSQYNEYLDYIYKLCQDCGFHTEMDRLKIPSTKRICFIGRRRKYMEHEYDNYQTTISYLVNNRNKVIRNEHEHLEIDGFKTRDPVEKVRNCTQVDKNVIESIIKNITTFLLDGCDFKSEWTPGKELHIFELIDIIPQDKLKVLKAECGGIQTLLKNNHHIFKVQNGKVTLRQPKSIEETTKNIKKQGKNNSVIKVQVRPCWFYNNHPQGCPLSDTSCSFLHTH
ncbi:unnamed protein product [Parnassius apollo]|uniref:tRNA (uracil-O(2)-)-methyltransferase n=1 Tax=Parnassius apollo TaxID=110799 RepID=A0A8S3WYY5_PARAO|nr:unnamed protein product [Parnassius apollo]